MQSLIDEAAVERMTLDWFQGLGYSIGNAEDPAFLSQRANLGDCILRDQYLTKLVRERKLTLAFPKTPTHEQQAYAAAEAT